MVLALATKPASSFPPISRRAIGCYSENGQGTEVKIDGEELLIMKESDVMGVLEGAKASRKVA